MPYDSEDDEESIAIVFDSYSGFGGKARRTNYFCKMEKNPPKIVSHETLLRQNHEGCGWLHSISLECLEQT